MTSKAVAIIKVNNKLGYIPYDHQPNDCLSSFMSRFGTVVPFKNGPYIYLY